MAGPLTCSLASRTAVSTSFLSGKSSCAMCTVTRRPAVSKATTLPTAEPDGCGGDKRSAKKGPKAIHLTYQGRSSQIACTWHGWAIRALSTLWCMSHDAATQACQVPPFDRRCFPLIGVVLGTFVQWSRRCLYYACIMHCAAGQPFHSQSNRPALPSFFFRQVLHSRPATGPLGCNPGPPSLLHHALNQPLPSGDPNLLLQKHILSPAIL